MLFCEKSLKKKKKWSSPWRSLTPPNFTWKTFCSWLSIIAEYEILRGKDTSCVIGVLEALNMYFKWCNVIKDDVWCKLSYWSDQLVCFVRLVHLEVYSPNCKVNLSVLSVLSLCTEWILGFWWGQLKLIPTFLKSLGK